MRLKVITVEKTSVFYDVEHGKFYYRIQISDLDNNFDLVIWSKTKPSIIDKTKKGDIHA